MRTVTDEATTGWAYRIGRILALVVLGLLPVHFFVPCQTSGATVLIALCLFAVVTGLSILARRVEPFVLAFIGFILHNLFVH